MHTKRTLSRIATIATLALAAALLSSPLLARDKADRFAIKGTATVTYVVDGDTMDVSADSQESWNDLRAEAYRAQESYQRDMNVDRTFKPQGNSFRVRIGGIDTPESVHRDKRKNTPEGKIASNYAKSIIDGKRVNYACWEIGYYGRPICSIYTDQMDFATAMMEAGHTEYVTKYGRHPFWHDHYRQVKIKND